ncbi:SPW repeat domain-containing protein [Athalassotoga saccharophila]|uniref:SPW repeat domain-containing protein n=1 Tax=Athalassotoga saccharophila TaxID=1441386 RepID=UPI001379E442|nr:hypothetical protein [Athalassotoga saccharophila]BBJ27823.1 hypothetical protein ATHSA_0714 [Athalassotoga saccharophila]
MTWRGWITLIIGGIWLIIASFIPLGGMGNLVNDLLVGIIVAIFGFLMIPEHAAWQGWIIGLIGGVWMIIAAFIPGITHSYVANLVNNLIVGIIVLIVSLFERPKKTA